MSSHTDINRQVPPTAPASLPDRLQRTHQVILWFVLPTLLVTLAVRFDLTPFLRGPGEWPPEWRWPYKLSSFSALPSLLLLVVIVLIVLWWYRTRDLQTLKISHILVLSLLSASFILAVHLSNNRNAHTEILFRTLKDHSGEYFNTAGSITDLSVFLHTYSAEMTSLSSKLSTHPPGNIVFYWVFHKLTSLLPMAVSEDIGAQLSAVAPQWIAVKTSAPYFVAAALAGFTVVALSALALIPLYFLGSLLLGHQRARQAALLYFFMPILTMLVPTIDQVYIFLAITSLWLFYDGLIKRSPLRLFLSGICLSLGIFMSFSLLPLLFIALLLWLWSLWQDASRSTFSSSVKNQAFPLVSVLAGISIVWVLAWVNPISILLQSISTHQAVPASRSYFAWLFYNPYDLFLFLGTPAAVMVFVSACRIFRRRVIPKQNNQQQKSGTGTVKSGDVFLLAVFLALVILFLSGIWRGETARALAYFYPLLILSGQVRVPVWSTTNFFIICAATLFQTLVFYSTISIG